jgi:hypothetical protein
VCPFCCALIRSAARPGNFVPEIACHRPITELTGLSVKALLRQCETQFTNGEHNQPLLQGRYSFMRQRPLLAAVLLAATGIAAGNPLPIRSFSFEQPGEGKVNMTEVPGWRFDGTGVPLAGVETGYEPSDGSWSTYLEGGAGGTPIWQLTDYVIGEGDVFELKVDARITWAATTMEMALFYDADGTRIVIASRRATLSNSMMEYGEYAHVDRTSNRRSPRQHEPRLHLDRHRQRAFDPRRGRHANPRRQTVPCGPINRCAS